MQSIITALGEKNMWCYQEIWFYNLVQKNLNLLRLHTSPKVKKKKIGGAVFQQDICEVGPRGFLSTLLKDGMRPAGVEYKETDSQVADCSSDIPAFQSWKWYFRLFIYQVLCTLTSPPVVV